MRTSVALAVLSGCLMLGCGDEGAERAEELSQGSVVLLTTTYLPIAKVSYSSYSLMTFILAKPFVAPLFLGSLSFQVIPGTSIVTGHITPGTSATSPGRANMQVSQDVFDSLLTASTSTGQHTANLTFDELTLKPTAITVQ